MDDLKMYVPNVDGGRAALSRRLQEHAFSLGLRWFSDRGQNVNPGNTPFLYFSFSDKVIAFSYGTVREFDESPKREITPVEFMEITPKDVTAFELVKGELYCFRDTHEGHWTARKYTGTCVNDRFKYKTVNSGFAIVAPFDINLAETTKESKLWMD